jgi:hypothetical protein
MPLGLRAPETFHDPLKLGERVDVLIDPDHPERYTGTSVASISMKKHQREENAQA